MSEKFFLEKKSRSAEEKILERAKELEPEILEHYTNFHENPELSGQEYETATYIKKYLETMGVEILAEKIGVPIDKEKGGTGLIARIRGQEEKSRVALRADMDALPIQEAETHELRSKNKGIMHACGHDSHSAGLLGAAKILKELADKKELPADVILLFQPSEEKTSQKESGAVQMIKSLEKLGLRQDLKAIFGLHVMADRPRGEILLKEGVQTASSGEVDIKLTAPGGHIYKSYEDPNLNQIFSQLTVNLNNIFRDLSINDQTLINSSRTEYNSAGYNVLATQAQGTWVIRIASENYKKLSGAAQLKIKEIAQEVINNAWQEVNETKRKKGQPEYTVNPIGCEITIRSGYRPVIHRSPELVALAATGAGEVLGPKTKISDQTMLGGEDFSFYLEKLQNKRVDGAFLMVGTAAEEAGYPPVSHHRPDFKVNPAVIKDLSALYSNLALKATRRFS